MNISEDMAATTVAEPSTQVERKARIAINGLGTSLIPRTDAGSSTARIRVTATPRPTAGRRPPSIYRCLQNTVAQARQIAEPRHERTLSAVACSRLLGPAPAPDRLEKRFLTLMLPSQHFIAFPAPAIPATGDRAIPAPRCKAGSRPARSWPSTRCSEVTLLRQKAPELSRTSLA